MCVCVCVCVTSDLPAARRKYRVVQAWTPKQYALRAHNGGKDIYPITDMPGSLVTVIPFTSTEARWLIRDGDGGGGGGGTKE